MESYIQGLIQEIITGAVHNVAGHGGRITEPGQLEEICLPFEKLFLRRGEIPFQEYSTDDLSALLLEKAQAVYKAREAEFGLLPETGLPLMRELERVILLRVVDEFWMEHIDAMHELRQSVGLRAYGQSNPVDEYKREGFEMFEAMVNGIKEEVVRRLFIVRVKKEQALERKSVSKTNVNQAGGDASAKKQPVRKAAKVGRNDPCPCGSGKKYKHCCGR